MGLWGNREWLELIQVEVVISVLFLFLYATLYLKRHDSKKDAKEWNKFKIPDEKLMDAQPSLPTVMKGISHPLIHKDHKVLIFDNSFLNKDIKTLKPTPEGIRLFSNQKKMFCND